MDEQNQKEFKGFGVVEIYGHTKAAGYVTAEYFGSACLFRIDTPELPERDHTMTEPGYADGRWVPAGTIVRRPASPARTKLIGPNSIFSLNPCDEAVAMKAIEEIYPRPLIILKMPEVAQIAPAAESAPVDPVCGAEVVGTIHQSEFNGEIYVFCSRDCMVEFQQTPEDYVDDVAKAAEQLNV